MLIMRKMLQMHAKLKMHTHAQYNHDDDDD